MAAPTALITSCSEKEPVDIIKQIIGTQNIPESTHILEDIYSYPWKVETKYYTADIRLCCTNSRTIGDKHFADNVHAFIVHFDSNDSEGFNRVKMWLPFLKEILPEVQLLVCDRCDESKGLSKADAWAWCLDNSFELVELDPVVDEQEDEDDDFGETLGIKRVIQALHAHTWPNLEMKDETTFRSPYMNKMMMEEALEKQNEALNKKNAELNAECNPVESADSLTEETSCDSVPTQDNTKSVTNTADEATPSVDNSSSASDLSKEQATKVCEETEKEQNKSTQSDTACDSTGPSKVEGEDTGLSALSMDDGSEESFEQLFEKFAVMKDKAAALPLDQRKAYAEKVAIEFWRSIGGTEDEIEGLSDSD